MAINTNLSIILKLDLYDCVLQTQRASYLTKHWITQEKLLSLPTSVNTLATNPPNKKKKI